MFSQGQSAFQEPSPLRAKPLESQARLEPTVSSGLKTSSPITLDLHLARLTRLTRRLAPINTRRTSHKMHSRTSRRPAVGLAAAGAGATHKTG